MRELKATEVMMINGARLIQDRYSPIQTPGPTTDPLIPTPFSYPSFPTYPSMPSIPGTPGFGFFG